MLTDRTYELWLLEDMDLVAVACVSLDCGDGEYVTEYREIKEGDPWVLAVPMLPDAALEQMPDGILQRIHRIHKNSLSMSCNRRERR